jgi:hypothetical protein
MLLAAEPSPFCDECKATREYFHKLCDYIVAEKSDVQTIFTAGYFMRDLVAGYQIFGEKKYLDTAVAYADRLLAKQSERGYWGTGYGRIYLADTGSALGLLIVLYPHVDAGRQHRYLASVQKYVDAIEKDGLIRPSGALDVGLKTNAEGQATVPYKEDYTISSALTGGEIYTWMYHVTGKEKYREVAYHALRWIFSTMRGDGVIPYNLPSAKANLSRKGDPKNDEMVWQNSLYLTSAYVGEGLLSFDLYSRQPDWNREFRAAIKPQIDYVLRTQNSNGTWAPDSNWDQKRSPGIVNLLTWYYDHVEKDPRIVKAVRKFADFILVPENAKSFGMGNDGAVPPPADRIAYDCVTGLTGRAFADILRPGVDAAW